MDVLFGGGLVALKRCILQYTDEEVDCCYEEFYEDVHTEFLKFGEIVNFKVCRNGSFHLRGNVYVHYKSLESAILAYNYMNGRYFAGKQITCEFVGVTRWKVAICGEYMKSRFKTCSHGTACNFIHCFRNPGGDYEWADWDKPPPKYWVKKMVALFGAADESTYENCTGQDSKTRSRSSSRKMSRNQERFHSRRSKSRDIYNWDSSSGGDSSDENRNGSSRSNRWKHSRIVKYEDDSKFENGRFEGRNVSHNCDPSDSPGKDNEPLSNLSRTSTRHPKKGSAFPNYDKNIDDENDYVEHDQYRGMEGRKHDSARRHSRSEGNSSKREDSSRRAKKENVLDEHIMPVNNSESKSYTGCHYRSESHDSNPGLDSSENIDQLDRWEAGPTFSGENEKYGNDYMNGKESYDGKYKSREERLGRQRSDIKTRSRSRSRSRSQLCQRTKSTSQEEEASSSGEDVRSKENHKDRRSHDRRKDKKKTKATHETFRLEDSNGKSDDDNARFHHSEEHERRHSHKHRGGSRRENHQGKYGKQENDKPSDLGTENLKRKGSSGKRSRSQSPARHSSRLKRERHFDRHGS